MSPTSVSGIRDRSFHFDRVLWIRYPLNKLFHTARACFLNRGYRGRCRVRQGELLHGSRRDRGGWNRVRRTMRFVILMATRWLWSYWELRWLSEGRDGRREERDVLEAKNRTDTVRNSLDAILFKRRKKEKVKSLGSARSAQEKRSKCVLVRNSTRQKTLPATVSCSSSRFSRVQGPSGFEDPLALCGVVLPLLEWCPEVCDRRDLACPWTECCTSFILVSSSKH
ncbi:MAG: hypothetical protein J3Q66DRAFT_92497 [Benniella sp.]|nr:MAG: hypothetical protein J3Q66DRAFT_92497 [Benniella sp.]